MATSIEAPIKDESIEENQTGFCLDKKDEEIDTAKPDPLIVKMGTIDGSASVDNKDPGSLKVETKMLSTSRKKVPLESPKPSKPAKKEEKAITISNHEDPQPDSAPLKEPKEIKEPVKKNDTLVLDPAKFNLNVQEQNSLHSIANSSLYIDVKKTVDSNGQPRKPQLSEIDSPNSVHKSKRSRRGKSRRDMPHPSDEGFDRSGEENYPRAELFALSDQNKKLMIEIN
mmetsp:Transcript_22417/g.34677  ORF Transcript_22417/g.34677 Transcript_22417/m.34677 type:complete len:227 (+) Transcript_22417:973-1653(+)